MSARPHEHFYLDEITPRAYGVYCATCSEFVGHCGSTDPYDWEPLARGHWEEVYERGPRATARLRDPRQ